MEALFSKAIITLRSQWTAFNGLKNVTKCVSSFDLCKFG